MNRTTKHSACNGDGQTLIESTRSAKQLAVNRIHHSNITASSSHHRYANDSGDLKQQPPLPPTMKRRIASAAFLAALFLFTVYNLLFLVVITRQETASGGVNKISERNDDGMLLGRKQRLLRYDEVQEKRHIIEKDPLIDEVENWWGMAQSKQPKTKETHLTNFEVLPVFFSANIKKRLAELKAEWGVRPDNCRRFANKTSVDRLTVVNTTQPTWTHCGRAPNAHALLADGSTACVRYRHPHDFLVAGEVLSFYLARELGLDTTACVILTATEPLTKWNSEDGATVDWKPNQIVALIEWIPGLGRNPISPAIVKALQMKRPVRLTDLSSMKEDEQLRLAQWVDMILFDFLTAQYDRFASLQDEADKQNMFQLLKGTVRNAALQGGRLLRLFDNEAGMLDGYLLVYEQTPSGNHLRFQTFHRHMLNAICVFRQITVHRLNRLLQQKDPLRHIIELAKREQPLLGRIDFESDSRFVFLKDNFVSRLAEILNHVKHCADESI